MTGKITTEGGLPSTLRQEKIEFSTLAHGTEIPGVYEALSNHPAFRKILTGVKKASGSDIYVFGSAKSRALNETGLPIKETNGVSVLDLTRLSDLDCICVGDIQRIYTSLQKEFEELDSWNVVIDTKNSYETITVLKRSPDGNITAKISLRSAGMSDTLSEQALIQEELSSMLFTIDQTAIRIEGSFGRATLFDPKNNLARQNARPNLNDDIVYTLNGVKSESNPVSLEIVEESTYSKILHTFLEGGEDELAQYSDSDIYFALMQLPRAAKYVSEGMFFRYPQDRKLVFDLINKLLEDGFPQRIKGKETKFKKELQEGFSTLLAYSPIYSSGETLGIPSNLLLVMTTHPFAKYFFADFYNEEFDNLQHVSSELTLPIDYYFDIVSVAEHRKHSLTAEDEAKVKQIVSFGILELLAKQVPPERGINSIDDFVAILCSTALLCEFITNMNIPKTEAAYNTFLGEGLDKYINTLRSNNWVNTAGPTEVKPPIYWQNVVRVNPMLDDNFHTFNGDLDLAGVKQKVIDSLKWEIVSPIAQLSVNASEMHSKSIFTGANGSRRFMCFPLNFYLCSDSCSPEDLERMFNNIYAGIVK